MRIIAGKFRGRVIKAPKGQATRPTTDRVRESIMNMVASARNGFEGAVVLDAFAGSGALGFEALSRGAQSVVFYECGKEALHILHENIKTLGIGSSAAYICHANIFEKLRIPASLPFDLIFLDPPYLYKPSEVLNLITYMHRRGEITDNALIAYEHHVASVSLVDETVQMCGMVCLRRKKYGDTTVDILRVCASCASDVHAV